LRLEHQLNESFKDILSRGVSHVAPVVSVDEANRTQSGDDLYMAFFKPEDDNYWKGNLKKYGLDRLIRTECGRTEPEWTVTDSQTVTDAQGTHRKVTADCNGAFYASSISYWTNPLEGGDGGFVDRGGSGARLLSTLINPGSSTNPDSYHLGRTILTYEGVSDGSLVKFNRANISRDDLTVGTDLYRDKLINFMYGYTNDANTNGTPKKKRPWILGDIIHSEPRVIDYFDEDGELEYRFVAVGSNDGMIHIFNDFTATIGAKTYGGGDEIAAFVPTDLLPRIKELADPGSHIFTVDGSPVLYRSTEKDPDSGYNYKTLIFGERKGGRSYWMLDVTSPNPADWKVKRHIQGGVTDGITTSKTTRIEELGYTWSKPVFTRLRTSDSDIKDVVIFTGGYDPLEDSFPEEFLDLDGDGKWDPGESYAAVPGGSEGHDAYNPGKNIMGRGIFVMDIETGDILFKATFGDSDITTGTEQTYTSMKYCFPADPSVISFSERKKVIYSADVYGQIWKITFNYNASSAWTVQRVFTANPGYSLPSGSTNISSAVVNTTDSGRKAFYSPDVSFYGNEYTDYPVLYFGTGDREHPKSTMISDRFYSVVDSGTFLNEGNLLNLTCDELDVDADIVAPEGHDGNDKTIQDNLKNLLTNGSAKGFYRILDKQSDCYSGIGSHVGEKVLSKPTLFAENVYFTTYQPVLGEPCNPLGNAYIYALNFSFGTAAFNYNKDNDDFDGKNRTLLDTFRKIEDSSIPSGVRVIMREGEAAGFVSAGGNIIGAGEEGSTDIPGPPGGVSRLIWKTE
jgi:type IV pilus assembly protein PilY1